MENLKNMSRAEQVAYWVGLLCVAIGRGKFHEEVNSMIEYYQRDAYERGLAKGRSEHAAAE